MRWFAAATSPPPNSDLPSIVEEPHKINPPQVRTRDVTANGIDRATMKKMLLAINNESRKSMPDERWVYHMDSQYVCTMGNLEVVIKC